MVGLCALGWRAAKASESSQWIQRSPIPASNMLTAVAAGNGVFVAVGYEGTILSSRDAAVWVRQDSGATRHLSDVAFGAGRFVATGFDATTYLLLTSVDGHTWSRVESAPELAWTHVTFGNGMFAATTSPGKVALSQDGVNWSAYDTGTTAAFIGIGYGNGTFVALTDVNLEPQGWLFLISTNGISWDKKVVGRPLRDVAWKDGVFVIVGEGIVLRSTDAQDWMTFGSGSLRAITATETGFVAVGDDYSAMAGIAYTSADGISWFPHPTPTPWSLMGVTAEAGKVIAVGYAGSIITSPDGQVWTERALGNRAALRGAFRGPGAAVAVGQDGVIVTSTDDIQWITQASGTTVSLYDVTFARETWVVVGESGTILTSKNARDWTARPTNPAGEFAAVTYAQGLFVAVGGYGSFGNTDPKIWVSPDGAAWSDRSPPSDPFSSLSMEGLSDVVYSPEHQAFVAVGDGTVVVSPDGWMWNVLQPVTGLANPVDSKMAYGAGRFVVASAGQVLVSTNALNWVVVGPPLLEPMQTYSVRYWDGAFWIAGDLATAAIVLRSTDGLAWERVGIPTSTRLYGLSKGGIGLLAVGDSGTILERVASTLPAKFRPPEARILPDGSFACTLDSAPGTVVSLEASDDLRHWSPSQTVTNRFGRVEIVDPASASPRRFYRANR